MEKPVDIYRRKQEESRRALEQVQRTPLGFQGKVGAGLDLGQVRALQQEQQDSRAQEALREAREREREDLFRDQARKKRLEEEEARMQEGVRRKLDALRLHESMRQERARAEAEARRKAWLDRLEGADVKKS